MFLLIHDGRNDPITHHILENRRHIEATFGEPIVDVSVAKILQDATIYDVIEDGRPTLNWSFSDIGTITNSEEVKLISRVSHISKDLFKDFHPDDQEYAQSEFMAYMNFALHAFPVKFSEPTFFGLSGQQLPMPLQWQGIQKAGMGVQVPHYYLGSLSLCPFDFGDGNSKFIINSTYGYRHWRPGGLPQGDNVFAVRRPEGMPYFAFVVGERSFVMRGPQSCELNHEMIFRMQQMSVTIAKNLKCPIAELLFFVSQSEITFAVADIFPVATLGHQDFATTIVHGIKGFFERYPDGTHV